MAGKWVVVKEMIPGPAISDDAARLQLHLLCELVDEVGQEKFQQAVETAIKTCDRRPTIAMMRRLCGASSIEPSAVTEAWELVTRVVTRHIQRDGNGMARLVPKVKMVDGEAVSEPVPQITPDIVRAVIALGGWGNLFDAYPEWWSQRFQQFRELYWEKK